MIGLLGTGLLGTVLTGTGLIETALNWGGVNWSLVGFSFVAVFLSELGDKSQVAAIALGSCTRHPKAVFFGSASALLLACLIGVLIGEGTAAVLPTQWVKGAAAIGFLVMGVRLLLFSDRPEESESVDQESSKS